MYEREYGVQSDEPRSMGFKDFLGIVLIIGGVAVAVWILMNVYSLFTDPAKLTSFAELVADNLETSISSGDKQGVKIVIPSEILSYFIPLALLMIAAGIAATLITGGVRLLDSDIQRLSRRMITMQNVLTTKMDHIQNIIGKNK